MKLKTLELTEDYNGKRNGSLGCSVGALIKELDEEDAEIFKAIIASDKTNFSALSRSLKENDGINIGRTTIGRHRAGDCGCERLNANS